MKSLHRTELPKKQILLLLAMGVVICLFAVCGWCFSRNGREDILFLIVFLIGSSSLVGVCFLLKVIEWDGQGIYSRVVLFGARKKILWSSLARYERTTKLTTGFEYRLFGQDGTRIVVDDWQHLRLHDDLRALLMEKIAPFFEEKVNAALASNPFRFRCRHRKTFAIEGTGIRFEGQLLPFEDLQTIQVEKIGSDYMKDSVQVEKYALRFSNGHTMEVSTPMNDLDVFLEILKRKAPQAERIDVKEAWNSIETDQANMSPEVRNAVLDRLRKRNVKNFWLPIMLLAVTVLPFLVLGSRVPRDQVLESLKGRMFPQMIVTLVIFGALQIFCWASFLKTRKQIRVLKSSGNSGE